LTTAAYDIGDTRRLQTTFKGIDGVNADPTTVTFELQKPDGTLTTYIYLTDAELVKSTTGIYYVDWPFTVSGRHKVHWNGTGAVATAEPTEIHIRRKEAL
jgi:MarR-like DNA-binding transcriptional regulator SgrR of sgrS sRNA